MATVTKSFYDQIDNVQNNSYWTVVFTGYDQKATSNTLNVTMPTITAKYTNPYPAGYGQGAAYFYGNYTYDPLYTHYNRSANPGSGTISPTTWAVGTVYQVPIREHTSFTVNVANLFNSSNPTTRTIPLKYTINAYNAYVTSDGSSLSGSYQNPTTWDMTLGSITLDVPPTFDKSVLSIDTSSAYSGITTATVTVSNSAAYYGGSISSVTFTIGNQSVTSAGDDTFSILLSEAGTFTPTITVTDSRGQTGTYNYDPLVVNVYTPPTVSFDVERTDSTGAPDDEGTYGLIEATLTFADVIADAVVPSVVLTDDSGTQTTPTVTWYTDDTLTTTVTWSSLSSGDTVYGIFSGLSTQHSYQVSVRPRDSEGTGTAVTQTIGTAFYTVDFLAGGHGIAFGKPAANVGFECAMTATFEDTLQADGTATFGSDVLIDLPDYQTASTTDKAIYDAVVALGWDSDVLIN